MSTPYNQRDQPAFPALHVILEAGDERAGPFPALLDTGADVTLIPTGLLEQVDAPESEPARLRSYLGETRRVQLYLVGVRIEELVLPALYVVGDDLGQEIILGRDVLNKLAILLDGPQEQTHLLDQAALKRLRVKRAG